MSRQRLGAVLGALLLAVLGVVGMVAYVSGAEERAASGEVLAEVFVVDRRVPAGTEAISLESFTTLETVPQKLVNNDTVGALADVEGLVTKVELLPGEVLSIARFIDPLTFDRQLERVVDRPLGLQELTIALEPQRAGGGLILPGDLVGVLMSFDPFRNESDLPVEVDGGVVPAGSATDTTTYQALHKVLVTNVQLEEVPEIADREGVDDEETRQVRLVPSGNLLVTFAVDVATAERLIFGVEYGSIWLTREAGDTLETPSLIQGRGTIYDEVEVDDATVSIAAGDG